METTFRDGDKVAIASFADWPRVHTPWLTRKDDVLLALEALEDSRWLFAGGSTHAHNLFWWRGWTDLIDALGSYPGRKDIFLLASDVLATAEQGGDLFALSQHAQASRAVVHTIDLAWDQRILPVGLGAFARHLGGQGFTNGRTLADAVGMIRDTQCRFVLSFRPTVRSRTGFPPRLHIRAASPGFEIRHVASYDKRRGNAPGSEEALSRVLLQQWGQGITLEAGLWPLAPVSRGRQWKALLLVRVTVADPTAKLEDKTIEAVLVKKSKIVWSGRKALRHVDALASGDRSSLLVFPLTAPSGRSDFHVNIHDTRGSLLAVFRSSADLERVRTPSQAEHWYLAARLGRVEGQVVPIPELSGKVSQGTRPILVGYHCTTDSQRLDAESAVLIRRSDSLRVAVARRHLPAQVAEEFGDDVRCGWTLASPTTTLAPGVWEYFPSGRADKKAASLLFQVISQTPVNQTRPSNIPKGTPISGQSDGI